MANRGNQNAEKWIKYAPSQELSQKASASHDILKLWADWAKSSPMVRGLGRPSEENRTEIIPDRVAMRVESALSRMENGQRLVIRDAYLKSKYPHSPQILDRALAEFYGEYNSGNH